MKKRILGQGLKYYNVPGSFEMQGYEWAVVSLERVRVLGVNISNKLPHDR